MSGLVSTHDIKNFRPLLVGGQSELVSLLRSSLNPLKCHAIFSTHNGENALKIMERHRPNMMVIFDDIAGTISAEELVRFIRNPDQEKICTMPILLILGKATKASMVRAMALGVNEVITLPFSRGGFLDHFQSAAIGRDFIQAGKYFGPVRNQLAIEKSQAAH